MGYLPLEHTSFDVSAQTGFKLILHTPVPGTDAAAKVQRLAGDRAERRSRACSTA